MHGIEDIRAREYLGAAVGLAFCEMTDDELVCFLMYYVCGNTQRAIAHALDDISQPAVSKKLARAVEKVREQFRAFGIDV